MHIIAFGDSITYGLNDEKGGWVSRLRRELEKADIAGSVHVKNSIDNCGVRGDTTEDLLKRFDVECSARVERKDNPIILFSIGVNDSSRNREGSSRVPIETYRINLGRLFEKAKVVTDKIIFVGLFPADESRTTPINWNPDRSFTNNTISEYNSSIKVFCKENDLTFVDVFKQFSNKPYLELLSDGLHPNSKGHQKIYKSIMRALKKNGWVVE